MLYMPLPRVGRPIKEDGNMSAIRKEIQDYINSIPDSKLEALKPLLNVLADDSVMVETNLTDEEKTIIAQGRADYAKGGYVSLDSIGGQ